MENEVWKPIPGYEESYEASNMGNVRSVDRKIIRSNGRVLNRKGLILKPAINVDGYKQIPLSINGKSKTFRVANLVAIAFMGKRKGLEVDHINGIRDDDRLSNLRWVTHKENCNNIIFLNNQKSRNLKINSKYIKPLIQICPNTGIEKEWMSLSDACRVLNMDMSTVSKVCRGLRDKAYGYKWRYKNG